jgi:hypothetical protein
MLMVLEDRGNQGLISRELRLFACGCVRQIAEYIEDDRSRRAVDVAERYADGTTSEEELQAAYHAAELAEESIAQGIKTKNLAAQADAGEPDPESWKLFEFDDWHPAGRLWNAAHAAMRCADKRMISSNLDPELKYPGDWLVATAASIFAYKAGASHDRLMAEEAYFLAHGDEYWLYEDDRQADLVRCVFGNPFRRVVPEMPEPAPRMREFAQEIYSLRTFDQMPALGRELEAGGFAGTDLAAHCIQSHVHTRGCWVLDFVRGIHRSTNLMTPT